MKLVIIAISLALTACSTLVPVSMTFPEAPGRQAQVACPNLQKLKDDARLSDVSRTVTINYSTYYECAVKTDAWIEWYQIQRHIFESVGK
jgi:hypothetical protein